MKNKWFVKNGDKLVDITSIVDETYLELQEISRKHNK